MNKMDNMRYGFTGIAGFNKWHYIEGNDYGVWENIIRAEQHMNGQDVKNVIGSDYIQGRQHEQLEGILPNLTQDRGNQIEMQYYLAADKNNIVGYVYNRTVNYRTATTGFCSATTFPVAWDNFNTSSNISWNDGGPAKRLKINYLPTFQDYHFDFYSYPNGDFLDGSSFDANTGGNEKVIVEFPELSRERAIVWFVAKKLGGRDEQAYIDTLADTKITENIIYPNPTTGKLYLYKNYGKCEVYNSIGMKVIVPQIEKNREEIELDFKGYAKGVYYIYFTDNLKMIKICLI